MISQRSQRFINIILVAVLLISQATVLHNVVRVEPAEGASGLNALVGLINIINAANQRRRLYNEARDTQGEMNAYYDALIAEARNQFREQELLNLRGENTTFEKDKSNYIKLITILETERAAVTQQIEAEKNAARQRFNQALGQQIFNVLIQSPGGQQILNDVRQTIDGLRQAAVAVQAALGEGRPTDQLLEQVAQSVSDVSVVRNAVRVLGSEVGHKVDQALGGLLTQIDTAAANLQEGMQQAINKADELDGIVAGYQEDDRTPGAANGGTIRPVDGPLDAAMEALANASFIAASIRPDDGTRDTMRDRIREALMDQRNDRRNQLLGDRLPGLARCERVSQAAYQSAAAELGIAVETPADPQTAKYLVCYYTDSGEPICAALIGEALAAGEPTREQGDEGQEAGGQPPAGEPPLMVDPVTDKIFDGVFHGPPVCGEGEEYPYQWTVSLLQDDSGNVSGTIRFHACPNGGQAIYRVTGQVSAETPDTIILQGTKRESWGALDGTAPDQQQFSFTIGLPPSPNLGG
jgi:hypothetical protein